MPTSAAIALGPQGDRPLTPTMKNIITSKTEQNLVFYFFQWNKCIHCIQIRIRSTSISSAGGKRGKKVRLTSEEDLKQKGDQKETLPSGFRGIIFFFGKKARVLLFLNFKLIEMGSFSISFLGRNGNC